MMYVYVLDTCTEYTQGKNLVQIIVFCVHLLKNTHTHIYIYPWSDMHLEVVLRFNMKATRLNQRCASLSFATLKCILELVYISLLC